jgi:flagellar motor switch/type III secretory pathway protein FliN
VAFEDPTVTVTGANLSGTPLTVTLHPVTPDGLTDQTADKTTQTPTEITFDAKSKLAIACWQVQVKIGDTTLKASTDKPPKDQFAVAPAPTIDNNPKLTGNSQLTVTGTQLVDLSECGVPLTFEVLSTAAGATTQRVTKATLSADGKQATLDLPKLATGAKWKEVHVLLNGKQVGQPTTIPNK